MNIYELAARIDLLTARIESTEQRLEGRIDFLSDRLRIVEAVNNLQGAKPPESIRVRAHCLSVQEHLHLSHSEVTRIIKALYRDQQVYTHVDVYSPAEHGENLLYRVQL